ncbi:superoxide dismutase family protein [Mycobacterium lentiflavum]|uniref:superoxide dismutase family protein n=1 Tax=Mycobacterium lentiflavum TaxID=141349 RepID=UPI001FD25E7E|nr:superoxide dismutase family protein [Mycobacterium lentiflavum]
MTATVAALAACTSQQGNQASTSSSTSSPPGAEHMTTQLKSADGTQVGTATIDFANGYATVTVEAGPNQVLSPGFHALMIHAVGRCDGPEFASAGSVYQAPDHTGFPASGDLTALQVRSDGSAKLVTTTNLLTAANLRNSAGSALIVHQAADNLSSPAPDESNKRVACGVIAAPSASSTTTTSSVTTVTTTAVVPPPSVSTSTVTVTSLPTMPSTVLTPTTATRPSLPPGT